MEKVFLDTNVLLDCLLKRDGFFDAAFTIIKTLIDDKRYTILVSSVSYTTIAYVARKSFKGGAMYDVLNFVREMSTTATVDDDVIGTAISSRACDFEDAVQCYSALKSGANCIVTRNKKDFLLSELPVMTPQEFMQSHNLAL